MVRLSLGCGLACDRAGHFTACTCQAAMYHMAAGFLGLAMSQGFCIRYCDSLICPGCSCHLRDACGSTPPWEAGNASGLADRCSVPCFRQDRTPVHSRPQLAA